MSESEKITNEEEDYDFELIDLEDEEGNTVTFEVFYRLEVDGAVYYALTPYSEDENSDSDEDEDEVVFLKEMENDGEKYLDTIDSDEEYDRAAEAFFELFSEMFDYEENE
ncbi:MAG: DUF1292 domain-containing protein [Eubacterium sp.]|nr:DUF1292 domain-containing protein [Eubacterium sp.]